MNARHGNLANSGKQPGFSENVKKNVTKYSMMQNILIENSTWKSQMFGKK